MDDRIKDELENVLKIGRTCIGKRQLVEFLKGKKLSPIQAIRAHCYQCMGYFSDGKEDCCIYECPLYSFMRFGEVVLKEKQVALQVKANKPPINSAEKHKLLRRFKSKEGGGEKI